VGLFNSVMSFWNWWCTCPDFSTFNIKKGTYWVTLSM
jgi:hypothetical protein